jgi:hypothetical protein
MVTLSHLEYRIWMICQIVNRPWSMVRNFIRHATQRGVGGDGLVVPSWLGFWVRISAQTPILRNTTTGGDIRGGFRPEAGSPHATSQYIGSVRIISEAPLVCPNGC